MSDFWKAYYEERVQAYPDDLCKQVIKTVNNQSLGEELLQLMADNVVKLLGLNIADSVLDLCCGNGLITQRIADRTGQVLGIDYSDALIAVAERSNQACNVSYRVGDATQLDSDWLTGIKKCYMHESLAHFNPETLKSILGNLRENGITQVLFAGVPDRERIWDYYNTDEKKAYYWQCEQAQRPHMGRWWNKSELHVMADNMGCEVEFYGEPEALPTSYYRFICLMRM